MRKTLLMNLMIILTLITIITLIIILTTIVMITVMNNNDSNFVIVILTVSLIVI